MIGDFKGWECSWQPLQARFLTTNLHRGPLFWDIPVPMSIFSELFGIIWVVYNVCSAPENLRINGWYFKHDRFWFMRQARIEEILRLTEFARLYEQNPFAERAFIGFQLCFAAQNFSGFQLWNQATWWMPMITVKPSSSQRSSTWSLLP